MAGTLGSSNEFPSLLIKEGTAPASPAAGDQRLFIDSADHALKVKNSGGTVTAVGGGVPTGTSMPGSPATNDLIFRTDLGLVFFWNGTRWLSLTLYIAPMSIYTGFLPTTGTTGIFQGSVGLSPASDVWLEKMICSTYVPGTNNGSNYWTLNLINLPTGTTIATVATSADTASTWTSHIVTINALLGTTQFGLRAYPLKTSNPGSLDATLSVSYRIVGT